MSDRTFGHGRRGRKGRHPAGSLRALAGWSAMAMVAAAVTVVTSTVLPVAPAAAADGSCVTVTSTVTCTFAYNGTDGTDGSTQSWTVPAGVTQAVVTADGAQGGGPLGGLGGEARSSLAVTPGETLWVRVGGDPVPVNGSPFDPGGFNGGGQGWFGSGGGASDVRQGADDLDHRVVVAGGGGGSGAAPAAGGAGGGASGADGDAGAANTPSYPHDFAGGGQGGSATAGGAGGTVPPPSPGGDTIPGADGALGLGGGAGSGGGGGGLYGGGAGSALLDASGNSPSSGGGGGGSAFVPGGCATPDDAAAACTADVRSGHGSVTIAYDLGGAAPSAPTGVSAVGGTGTATVSWSAPATGPTPTGYVVVPHRGTTILPGRAFDATAVSRSISDLPEGGTYTFVVVATNGSGSGPPSSASNAVLVLGLPGVPTGVTAAIVTAPSGPEEASVSWVAPTNDGGSAITGYRVTPYQAGNPLPPVTFTSTATTQVMSGLSLNVAYTFSVATQNAQGFSAESAVSNAVTPRCTTAAGTLSCPFAYNGTDGTDGSVQPWVVPPGVTWVTVAADGAQGGNGGNGGEGRSGLAVTPGETLWIRVGGDGGTVGSDQGDPSLPGGYNGGGYSSIANGGGASDVRQGADDLQHRVVVGGGGGGGGVGAGGVGGGATGGNGADGGDGGGGGGATATGGGAGGSGNYDFGGGYWGGVGGDYGAAGANVGPAGGGGLYGGGGGGLCYASILCPPGQNSGGGGGGSAFVPGGCATPSDPTASCTPGVRSGHGVVVVSWVLVPGLPSAPRSVSAAAGDGQAAVTWSAPASNGGAAIDSYTVTATPGGKTCTWSSGPLTCAVTGLANGTSYTFRVVAHNAVGNGPLSAPSNAVVPAPIPGAPTAVTASAGDRVAMVTWAAPAGAIGIDSYTVTSSPDAQTCTWTSGPLECFVAGLTNGTTYTFTVTAHSAAGNGPPSSPSNAVVPMTWPGAPTAVTAAPGDAQATVTWSAPASDGGSPITEYTVTSSPGAQTCTWSSGPLTCTVAGLANGTSYTFTVRATNIVGTGSPSGPSNAVTPSTVPGAPAIGSAVAGHASATVTWSIPASDGGAPITGYTVTSSPDAKTCTWSAGPLSCTVSGLTPGTAYTFTVRASNADGPGAESAASNSVVPWSGATFHSLAPTRILDSRGTNGGWNTKLTAATPRTLTVIGGTNSIPASAEAVVMNVTVTGGTANSFVTAYPAGASPPTASNLNFAAGETIANLATVKVGTNGQVAFANNAGAVHVIADIVGYYDAAPGDRYNPLPPTRILDSRGSNGGWNAKLGANVPKALAVRNSGGVPTTADAVIMNVTVTGATANSFLTVYPSGGTVPTASNVNFAAGQTIANLVTVKLGADGKVLFANNTGATDVIVDVVGFYDPSAGDVFHALSPTRILDSRGTNGGWNAKLASGAPRWVQATGSGVVPAGATAVIGNATVTEGSANSFLTLYPAGTPVPTASNVNFAAGQTIPNLTAVKLNAAGQIGFNNANGATHVIFDVVGYFAGT